MTHSILKEDKFQQKDCLNDGKIRLYATDYSGGKMNLTAKMGHFQK